MRRPTKLALAGGAILLAVLVVAQLVLPRFAEDRIAGDLKRFGPEPDVDVSAFPAVKLLFGSADSVTVRMDRATARPADFADELSRTGDAGELDAHAGELRIGRLIVRDARLTKDGDVLNGTATIRDADLRAALPDFVELRPAEVQTGDGVLLEGSASLLGATIRGRARVKADGGAITVAPEGIPLGALATFVVFQDARVRVLSVRARTRPGGYDLTATGRVVEG